MEARGDATGDGLKPTLWRTCRALANLERLGVFQHLLKNPDQAVSDVAAALQLSESHASQILRTLNARGLLGARRDHRWVYYRVAPDPSIPESAPLIRAIKRTFDTLDEPEQSIFRDATAFTHPRRVLIVRTLAIQGSLTPHQIRSSTGISRQALDRHFHKLRARGFVKRAGDQWELARPTSPLGGVLLRIASSRAR